MDGCALEDLGLDFSVPGFEHAELKAGGTGTLVTLDNVDEYVYLLSRFFLRSSVRAQFDAIANSFSDICRVPSLSYFQSYGMLISLCFVTLLLM
jgi:E3 ubiquitin-protein ligase TRIP12